MPLCLVKMCKNFTEKRIQIAARITLLAIKQ